MTIEALLKSAEHHYSCILNKANVSDHIQPLLSFLQIAIDQKIITRTIIFNQNPSKPNHCIDQLLQNLYDFIYNQLNLK